MSENFVPGMQLSAELARHLEGPLREQLAGVTLALALIGPGSDVLGHDTARSMDLDWGPRLTVIVPESERERAAQAVNTVISRLPDNIAGHPIRYSTHADSTLMLDPAGTVHRVQVDTLPNLLHSTLQVATLDELTDAVWLSTPMQSLLESTSGEVFVDDSGELSAARARLAFYPDQVWRYQLAALWMRVSQVNPFVGRAGELDDEVGSAVIASDIARDLMRIGLLQSRRYAPYSKWLGTEFARIEVGRQALPHLHRTVAAADWQTREESLNRAGEILIRQLNGLALIPAVPGEPERFHSRPFHVLPAEQIAVALHESLGKTPWPAFVGGIDIVTDSTDALKSRALRSAVASLFTR